MSERRSTQCRAWAAGGAAMVFLLSATAPVHVSGKPRRQWTVNPLSACLASPKGRTEAGKRACFEAAENPTDPFTVCLHSSKARLTYYGLMDCQRAELDRTYFRLQRLYADLARHLPNAQARGLQRERKAWFARRNKVCARKDLQWDMLECMIEMNEDKADQLKRRLRNPASARR
jgi:uncharacterized protein YecT (DUF1311 family)